MDRTEDMRALITAVEMAKRKLKVNDCKGAYDILRDASPAALETLPEVYEVGEDVGVQGGFGEAFEGNVVAFRKAGGGGG